MFSSLFGRSSSVAAQAYVDRIAFLMRFLEQFGQRPKQTVVAALREQLLLEIPRDVPDPEDRQWPDPSNRDIAISYRCELTGDRDSVNQFVLTGFGSLSNTLIIGSANDGNSTSFTWSASVESEARPIPALSRKVQEMFWQLPGYKTIGMGTFQFLVRL